MRRVLLVQPSLQPPGGGNGVAAWILQALARQCRVTVLSLAPVQVGPVNRFFGTSLQPGDFDTHVVPRRWTIGVDVLPVPAALLRIGLLMRYARRVSDAFDVVVGACNEADFGRRGIQYVHYPTYLRPRPEVDRRWYHRSAAILRAYYSLADHLAGASFERIRANLTLANSRWTAARVRALLGVEALTVYPPVMEPLAPAPWDSRLPGFLAVGRIAPEKEYERLIRILATVRARVPGVTLTIAGTVDRGARAYYRALRAEADSCGSWITFRHDLTRNDVLALMAGRRYGLHGMREEHFGMAPAEMVRAGMIVWVPNGGGQVEIVGDEPALRYDTDNEAAEQIVAVLRSPVEQQRLRESLAARAGEFSAGRFVATIREIVRSFRA
jgi:glycosyltransferase involved in cell wall biosynthesis